MNIVNAEKSQKEDILISIHITKEYVYYLHYMVCLNQKYLLTHIYIPYNKTKHCAWFEIQFLDHHSFNHVKHWHCTNLQQQQSQS